MVRPGFTSATRQTRIPGRGNTSWDNEGFGIFLRDASFGQVEHNWLYGNCVGIVFLHTGGGIEGWTATNNRAVANNRACAGNPEEEEPGFSGIGIAVAGAKNIDIEHNTVLDNRPSGETEFSGGVLVSAGGPPPEGVAPTGIRVAFNVAFGNQPFDLYGTHRHDPRVRPEPLQDLQSGRPLRERAAARRR